MNSCCQTFTAPKPFLYRGSPDYTARLIVFIRLKVPGAAGRSIYRRSVWTSCSFSGRPDNNGPSNRSSLSPLRTTPSPLSSDDEHRNVFTEKATRLSPGCAFSVFESLQGLHVNAPLIHEPPASQNWKTIISFITWKSWSVTLMTPQPLYFRGGVYQHPNTVYSRETPLKRIFRLMVCGFCL